jgi:hypothetical protein
VNNRFYNTASREYRLSGDASITIRGQDFDNTLIAEAGSTTRNIVEILDSGTIEVIEGETDGGGGGEDGDDGGDEQEDNGNLYNTDNQPYRRTLNDGDSITVNSS